MSSARAVCKCVVIGGKRGVGETWVLRSRRQLSSQKFVLTPSLSACWRRRSSGNTHAIVLLGPRQAFSNVARALAWAYQTPGTQPMGRAGEYSGCGVVWCGVPKALLPKGKRPGCLPTGTGKRAGLCVLCARCV